ncbi:uncharacterized protein N7459_008306 [Penicillium hispanicum]|uniref:uncharacterized protein n=1 Tax=Penicillium hispanicum TaxID=1080232 RepID=UPI0025409610|nr:uncharacterized protein N7459_008306 [Penicillium hispanicum]KAJ5573879.1 hypothetical protein N7459_008306 [Penicillium hispanicum]
MASPFNPFGSGRGQRGGTATGTASTTGRGRGAPAGRGSQFQSRGGFAPRASKHRGRGRGSISQSFRGRGAGASHAGAPTTETSSPAATNSPFAQLNKEKPVPSPFGGNQTVQAKSPFPASSNTTAAPTFNSHSQPLSGKRFPTQGLANGAISGPAQPVPVEDASVMARYNERYEQVSNIRPIDLKVNRTKQRQQAIKSGQMADPNQPTSLNKAITPVGTCTSMCPEFESVERIVQKMVDKSEKYLHPSTNVLQNMETKMLKRFRRSAAGYDEQLPSDIRTPKALLQSTNYLIRHILGGNEPLGIIHKFVWDRTRSIRNDFSVQQLTQEADVKTAVTCLERIARFHIVSLHLLSSPENEEPFDRHQEREQLNNTMLSLMYYYDDNRGRISFPNEDEFRAYYIIFSIHDQRPDLEARVQKWPASLLNSPRVQVALELYASSGNTWEYQGTLDARRPNAIAQGFYTRFFNIINSPSVSYLMACVAEIYFSYVRQTAIRAIWKGYCRVPASQQHKNEEWTVDELTKVLHFDNDEQTIAFCEEQDLQFAENANGQRYLNWGSRPVESIGEYYFYQFAGCGRQSFNILDLANTQQGFSPSSEHAFSETYVESKRTGRSLVAVVLGLSVRQAAKMGMIDPFHLHQRPEGLTPDDSLFVSDKDNQIPPPVVELNNSPLSETLGSEPTTASVRNIFQNPQPTSIVNQSFETQPSIPAPPQSTSPFASIFPGGASQLSAPASTAAPSNIFSPASSPFPPPKLPETSQPPNPFSSMFSASATKPTASSIPPAPSASPFSFSKPEEADKEKDKKDDERTGISTGGPRSSLFPGTPFTSTTPAPSSTPANPFAASLASFGTEQTTKETQKIGAFATAPSTSQPADSLFKPAKPLFPSTEAHNTNDTPATTTESYTPAFTPSFAPPVHPPSSPFKSPAPASTPSAPLQFPTPITASSPFQLSKATSTAAPTSSSPFQFPTPTSTSQPAFVPPPSALTTGLNGPTNIFSSAKTAPFGDASSPSQPSLFAPPKALTLEHTKSIETQETRMVEKVQDAAPPMTNLDQADQILTETPRGKAIINQDLPDEELTTSAFLDVYNIPNQFYPAEVSEDSNRTIKPVQEKRRKSLPVEKVSAVPLTAEPSSFSASIDSRKRSSTKKIKRKRPSPQPASARTSVSRSSVSTRPESSAPATQPTVPAGTAGTLGEPVFATEEERQAAWIEFIKYTRERQAQEKQRLERDDRDAQEREQAVGRKRAFVEPTSAESIQTGPGAKAAKKSMADQASLPPKYSLAEASVKNLPTLPCLQRVEELLKRKEPSEEEVEEARAKRKRQIDEDEILLSAARIAAEQMRTGPKIFDGYSSYNAYSEPRHYSRSPRSSFSYSASSPFAQSVSSPQYPQHGYEVAYAPDTPLAPGQTISRTEHRIRMTGAHGLAYKPLDFSQVKKDRKDRFSHSG